MAPIIIVSIVLIILIVPLFICLHEHDPQIMFIL